jgi:hypothetical protein
LRGGIALTLLDFRLSRRRRLLLLAGKLRFQSLLGFGKTAPFFFGDLVTNALVFDSTDFGPAPRATFGSASGPLGLWACRRFERSWVLAVGIGQSPYLVNGVLYHRFRCIADRGELCNKISG